MCCIAPSTKVMDVNFNPKSFSNNLCRIALFVATFESFADFVTEHVKFFYCNGYKNGKWLMSDYIEEVHKKYRKPSGKTDPFYETLAWFFDNQAITQQEFELALQIRESTVKSMTWKFNSEKFSKCKEQ